MGDCRIRIQISQSIIAPSSTTTKSTGNATKLTSDCGGTKDNADAVIIGRNEIPLFTTITTSVYSADTTIEEVFEATTVDGATAATKRSISLRSLINSDTVSVWDCTTHPSINITQQCRHDMTNGRTKTLYTAGWYPSGYIQILPIHATNAISVSPESYDDIQYNRNNIVSSNNRATSSSGRVQLLDDSLNASDGSNILPSQLLHSVTQRFNNDIHEESSVKPEDALRIRLEQNRKKEMVTHLRNQKLDAHIHRLESSQNKNKGVSDQVRKMLIKSRATALRNTDKNIQMHDRVYLHCIMWYDHDSNNDGVVANTSSGSNCSHQKNTGENAATLSDKQDIYIYVSIQDTIGRVVDTFVPNKSLPQISFAKEMLWIRSTSDPQQRNEYQRFPSTLRIYEAIQQQSLSKDDVNKVIIRFFNPNEQVDTTCVVDAASNNHITTGANVPPTSIKKVVDSRNFDVETRETITINEATSIDIPIVAGGIYNQLWNAVAHQIYLSVNPDTKKISAKEKVRQMQMKSKATGDVKRIKQLEHRLYLQMITAEYNPITNSIQINGNSPVFVSRYDAVQRIVSDRLLSMSWELLVPIMTDATTGTTHHDSTSSNHTFRLVVSSMKQNDTEMTWDNLLHHGKVNCFGNVLLLLHAA